MFDHLGNPIQFRFEVDMAILADGNGVDKPVVEGALGVGGFCRPDTRAQLCFVNRDGWPI